ncbi:hypothetical protein EJ110_NYTH03586 [Nymphaea thermarum]|nr:hypothetical protein EJ110_NYTH03586 [Nymphaea thermarum]
MEGRKKMLGSVQTTSWRGNQLKEKTKARKRTTSSRHWCHFLRSGSSSHSPSERLGSPGSRSRTLFGTADIECIGWTFSGMIFVLQKKTYRNHKDPPLVPLFEARELKPWSF